jgi:hypothetical protein
MTTIITEAVSKKNLEIVTTIDGDPEFLSTVIELLIEDLAWIKEPSSSPVRHGSAIEGGRLPLIIHQCD